jgi:hypothetical protein
MGVDRSLIIWRVLADWDAGGVGVFADVSDPETADGATMVDSAWHLSLFRQQPPLCVVAAVCTPGAHGTALETVYLAEL